MARRGSLPETPSRIFTRRSRSSRIFSAILITLSVFVTLTGLATAIYLERSREAPPVRADSAGAHGLAVSASAVPASEVREVVANAPAEGSTHDPLAAAAAVPPPAPPEAPSEPRAGSTTPLTEPTAPQTALLETPPLATPSAAMPGTPARIATQYWVEYGVFAGEGYARRLQRALAARGLEATVVPTHTPKGRPLIRVRSLLLDDQRQAHAAARSARAALKIGTLVHRVPAPPTSAAAAAHQPGPPASRGYWVQFGAFPHRDQAARLQAQLARGGLPTVISAMRASSGRTLFCVRSIGHSDRQTAVAAARRGQRTANVDFLVGRAGPSTGHPREMAPSSPPDMHDSG